VVAIVSSRLVFREEFRFLEVTGIVLIGGGLAILSALNWWSARRTAS
jgi:hypothetical protein